MALGEEQGMLESFVDESRKRVRGVLPLVQALVLQPDQADLLPQTISSGFRLFYSIKRTGAFLGLAHLTAPAEAMEYLLDRVRAGVLPLTPQRLALLAESCTFMDQGLVLILREKTDQRLAASAAALSAAIFESAHAGENHGNDGLAEIGTMLEDNELFLQECEHFERLLATVEQEFVLWDFIAVDHRRVGNLCRLLHSLRQNFASCNLDAFAGLCMALESTLNRYVQGEFFQTEYPERVFLRGIDAMREALSGLALGKNLVVADFKHHLAAVQGLIRQPIGELLIEAGLVDARTVDEALTNQQSLQGKQPLRLGEVLVAMGEVTEEQVLDILQEQQGKRARAQEAEAAFASARLNAPASLSFAQAAPQEVGMDGRKFARMIAVIKQVTAVSLPEALQPLVAEAHALALACNREALFSYVRHFQRLVQELARRHQKQVHLSVHGEDVLLEEVNMSAFADLLAPLLRNSVVHGLESAEDRVRLGKHASGRLTLTALRQGKEIWVSVEDDGQGFDRVKLAALSVARGLIAAEKVEQCSLSELLQALWGHQDLATGTCRGDGFGCTGLGAVQAQLQSMQGRLEMRSSPGKGARATLRVPRAS